MELNYILQQLLNLLSRIEKRDYDDFISFEKEYLKELKLDKENLEYFKRLYSMYYIYSNQEAIYNQFINILKTSKTKYQLNSRLETLTIN